MTKRTYEELEDLLAEARAKITPGSNWRHYKGGEYTVADIVVQESDNELAVVYSPLTRSGVSFVRPLAVWQDSVEWDGTITDRFTPI